MHIMIFYVNETSPDAKYCVYPECTKLTSLSGGAESDSIDVLVSTRNHFCGQEHWNGAVKKGEVLQCKAYSILRLCIAAL